jgi:HEAT repeat protein
VAFESLARAVDDAVEELRTHKFTEEFQVETDTPLGKIICGGVGRNVYTNEAFLIIDLGGDDVYSNSAGGANGLVGRPIAIVVDLAGNDQYISRRSFSQGSGVFGIGILVDCGGDDVYEAKHLSQGAGFFGCGLLTDYAGHDKFAADTFVEGAAEFGAGILWQRGGDTTSKATELAQGFGGTSGFGLLLDEDGNDSYLAGGKYPCGWLPGHFFSLSQGFGYGMRPFTGGGIGILCDLHGDDHYVADVYGQGASYWYSTGLLLDGEGNDTYEAYQYCQGAGIHLSNGALIDWSGNDAYTAGHICQGGAHDYSVGMLLDLAGNDRYEGDTTAQGSAINNSFALLLDRSGNDNYIGKDPKQSQAAGHNGDKREYGSIAVLLDLAGDDRYSQGQSNNTVWLKPLYGAGLDTEMETSGVPVRALSQTITPRKGATIPSKRLYVIEPVDPHQPIEHLLRVAISDKPDAEAAWKELKQQGTNALPYLLRRLDSPNVLVRAKTEELIDFLGTNSIPLLIEGIDHAKNDEVARLCCYFLARFNEKARAAIPHVMPLLDRDKTRSIALYTLGHLRAREAFKSAMKALDSDSELVRLRAAQALGRIGDKHAVPKLLAALNDEMWDVRYAAEDALVAFGKSSIRPLRSAFAKASPRVRPHIIEALARLGDKRALVLAKTEYRNDDSEVRAAVMQSLQAAVAGAR